MLLYCFSKIYLCAKIIELKHILRLPALAAGQDEAAAHGLHLAAAAGAGEAVQAEQVSVQTQAIRGRHQPLPQRDPGQFVISNKLRLVWKTILEFFILTLKVESIAQNGSNRIGTILRHTQYLKNESVEALNAFNKEDFVSISVNQCQN